MKKCVYQVYLKERHFGSNRIVTEKAHEMGILYLFLGQSTTMATYEVVDDQDVFSPGPVADPEMLVTPSPRPADGTIILSQAPDDADAGRSLRWESTLASSRDAFAFLGKRAPMTQLQWDRDMGAGQSRGHNLDHLERLKRSLSLYPPAGLLRCMAWDDGSVLPMLALSLFCPSIFAKEGSFHSIARSLYLRSTRLVA